MSLSKPTSTVLGVAAGVAAIAAAILACRRRNASCKAGRTPGTERGGKHEGLPPLIYEYWRGMSFRDDAHLKALRDYTAKVPLSIMQVAPNEGAFLEVLAASMGAKKAIEVGVFTGYSALCTARGLAPGGKLLALDISDEHIPFASRVWREAGVADRIDFRKGDARAILKQLSENPSEQGTWDLAFIDADKVSYDIYYEHILKLLRKGGVIAVDNVLWDGAVADPLVNDEDTKALRALNKKIHADPRVKMASIPLSDGVTLALKL